jgi:CO/xanthine dehydrogenase FAD-binding subunit
MTISHNFVYHKPKTLAAACKLLAKFKNQAQILAGGTDLINWLKDDYVTPEALIDIKGIKGLDKIAIKQGKLHIGALVTFTDLLESKIINKKFPLFYEMAGQVASMGVRNRATIVGNICAAVPSCDSGPILMVYDATINVKSAHGMRSIPIAQWFKAPKKTALEPGELVTGITIDVPIAKNAGCYVKLGRYQGEDLAQASVTILLTAEKTNIAYGAVAPTPLRAAKIEKFLAENKWQIQHMPQIAELIATEIAPITDIRASKEYRLHMIKVMLERGLNLAHSRLITNKPIYGTKVI